MQLENIQIFVVPSAAYIGPIGVSFPRCPPVTIRDSWNPSPNKGWHSQLFLSSLLKQPTTHFWVVYRCFFFSHELRLPVGVTGQTRQPLMDSYRLIIHLPTLGRKVDGYTVAVTLDNPIT